MDFSRIVGDVLDLQTPSFSVGPIRIEVSQTQEAQAQENLSYAVIAPTRSQCRPEWLSSHIIRPSPDCSRGWVGFRRVRELCKNGPRRPLSV